MMILMRIFNKSYEFNLNGIFKYLQKKVLIQLFFIY